MSDFLAFLLFCWVAFILVGCCIIVTHVIYKMLESIFEGKDL